MNLSFFFLFTTSILTNAIRLNVKTYQNQMMRVGPSHQWHMGYMEDHELGSEVWCAASKNHESGGHMARQQQLLVSLVGRWDLPVWMRDPSCIYDIVFHLVEEFYVFLQVRVPSPLLFQILFIHKILNIIIQPLYLQVYTDLIPKKGPLTLWS